MIMLYLERKKSGYKKEGDTVDFNVRIDSSYPSTQKAPVKLYSVSNG